MSVSKSSRVPNFTSSEKVHLMRLIANKYASVLEDKKTDRTSSVEKEKAWQDIMNEFNASSNNSTYRSAISLKKCYENRKKELRKTLAEERKETFLTGGGPPTKIKKEESDDILMSILNKKTLVGLQNPFDDDADMASIELSRPDDEIEYISEPELPQVENEEILISQGPSASSTIGNSDNTTIKCQLDAKNNWKKVVAQDLQIPISNQLCFEESGSESKSGHFKTPIRSSSRRRPTTVIKTLTSSDIAKKYNMLLDKRLQLIDSQLKHAEKEKRT